MEFQMKHRDSSELRCSFCHAIDGELEPCPDCGTRLHEDCWDETGEECTTLGCAWNEDEDWHSTGVAPTARSVTERYQIRRSQLRQRMYSGLSFLSMITSCLLSITFMVIFGTALSAIFTLLISLLIASGLFLLAMYFGDKQLDERFREIEGFD